LKPFTLFVKGVVDKEETRERREEKELDGILM